MNWRTKDLQQVSTVLTHDQSHDLENAAERVGLTKSEAVREAVKEWIASQKGQPS
jgi:predicted DNA-binding protein